MPRQPPVAMVLVEDDLGHARLIAKNLERAGLSSHAVVLHDGQQALDYLFKENQYVGAEHSLPQVMLLDLNLPGLDGYHVLSRVKGDVCTQHMMVVVFTTTDDPQEISKAYALGCNACLTKSVDYEQFIEVFRKLRGFLSVVHLPSEKVPIETRQRDVRQGHAVTSG